MLEEITKVCGTAQFHEGIVGVLQEKLVCLLADKRMKED